jgi:hypothetical protein
MIETITPLFGKTCDRLFPCLFRPPAEVQELANTASLSELRLCPIVAVDDADGQPKAVQRVVEEGLFDRQLGGPMKEAKAPVDDEGKKNVGRARVKALPPRSLKSRLRSRVVQLDKHVQEMGGLQLIDGTGRCRGVQRTCGRNGRPAVSLELLDDSFRIGSIIRLCLTFGKTSATIGTGAERSREARKKAQSRLLPSAEA